MKRLILILFIVLAMTGCLRALQGMDVVVRNESNETVQGTVVLLRVDGDVVREETFLLEPGAHVVMQRFVGTEGRFMLNVTLDDGRQASQEVRAGGPYQSPQVSIATSEIFIQQHRSLPPRGTGG